MSLTLECFLMLFITGPAIQQSASALQLFKLCPGKQVSRGRLLQCKYWYLPLIYLDFIRTRQVLAQENLMHSTQFVFSRRPSTSGWSRTKHRKHHLQIGSSAGCCTAEITFYIKFALERQNEEAVDSKLPFQSLYHPCRVTPAQDWLPA